MTAALALGRQGRGRTAPNPSVGCVIVSSDGNGPVVVGAARTADAGRPHAERLALEVAGERARGATAYVTLEPCSHHGRTPPCADALIAAGIGRVVVAARDPNPLVSGRGLSRLREAGVALTVGVQDSAAERDLCAHREMMRTGRPCVTLKLAISADGAIGRRGRAQVAVSTAASRDHVHALRAASDTIAVGIGTALADDPSLTCRLPGLLTRSPTRVVFDTDARLPANARMLREPGRTIALVGEGAAGERITALTAAGAHVIEAPRAAGRLDLAAALALLAQANVRDLLLEGGAELAAAFLRDDLVQRLVIVRSPRNLGGDDLVVANGLSREALAPRFELVHRRRIDGDAWETFERRCSPA